MSGGNRFANEASIDEKLSVAEASGGQEARQIVLDLQTMFAADSIENLCDLRRPLTSREFIAACLLRLYRLPGDVLKGNAFHAARLCEVTFDNVSRDLRLSEYQQSFEKLQILSVALERAIQRGADVTNRFALLPQFDSARQDFFRAFTSAESHAFVVPFLPPPLRDVTAFVGLFEAVANYLTSEGVDQYRRYEAVAEAFSTIDSSGSTATWRKTYGGALAKLFDVLNADYRASDILKPAELLLVPASRKYPLQHGNHAFSIGLRIENSGPGIAFDTGIELKTTLKTPLASVNLGRVDPGEITIALPARVDETPADIVICEAHLRWTNVEGQSYDRTVVFELEAQDSRVDWGNVYADDIYSIDPVTTEEKLVGRQDLLKELTTRFLRRVVPSYLVHGQKRVGKTSVVRSLESALRRRDSNYTIVFAEAGDFRTADSDSSLSALGSTLAERLVFELPSFDGVLSVEFDRSIAPLGGVIDRFSKMKPETKFLFIIDEFDALPIELYRRGAIGDTLFLNLRSLSNKSNVGFVLVGSENMSQIWNQQGEQINRWENLELDYFDRDEDWGDFITLVRRPAAGILEYADDAVDAIYEYSAGNPFFTNLICRRVLDIAIHARDAFVSSQEIVAAVSLAARSEPLARFSHFWDDGIMEAGDGKELVSLRRRKLFCAIGDVTRRHVSRPREALVTHPLVRDLGETVINDEIRDLERRGIILSDPNEIRFKVKLFGEWLAHSGLQRIVLQYQGADSAIAVQAAQEQMLIRSEEIEALADDWIYQGRPLGLEKVRAWLVQFGAPEHQRMAFDALSALQFYTKPWILNAMRDVFDRLRRKYETEENRFFTRRRDFLVTHLDASGKSGTLMAKYFADENSLADGSVAAPSELRHAVHLRKGIRVIVALDDFVGTGESLRKSLKKLWDDNEELWRSGDVALHVVILVGFGDAVAELRDYCRRHEIRAEIDLCESLDNSARAFSDLSEAFPDPVRRRDAEAMIRNYGARLQKRWPVGYGDSQALVAFEHNIPNNSLPIFWSDAGVWKPLFSRR
ncbi:MAG: ATP-binding protein [Candidatus Eremiobacteraeota bacterium]|nr:ATP-binding protein [Candidatus Eremiobacteraeota bacterium]